MVNEHRKDPRAGVEIRIQYRTVGSFLSDYALNLSKNGVFVSSDNPLPTGSIVRLVFSLPETPFLFDVSGRVRWVQRGSADEDDLPGMGIEFVQLDDRVRDRLSRYVDKVRSEVPDSIQPRPARPRVQIRSLSGSSPDRHAVTQPAANLPPLGSADRRSEKKR